MKKVATVQHSPTHSAAERIFRLALPMIAGSILQQLYNTADAVIVGRFLGENRLAAVTVAGPVMSLLIFFIYGLGIGMNVLFSRHYGSGDREAFRETTRTALTVGCMFVLFLSLLFEVTARPVLIATNAPETVLADAVCYLRIILIGLVFNFLYNYNAAALLAFGNTRISFFTLAGSSVLNIVLDLLLVAGLGAGVAGAAAATVLAQCAAMLACTLYVRSRYPVISFRLRDLKADRNRLRELLSYSGASAFQQSVLYGGRLLVQGAVNTLPVSVIAGYGAACRIESFVLAPLEGIAAAAASILAKSAGRGDQEEVKEGFLSAVRLSLIFNLLISGSIFLAAPYVIPLFLGDISEGAMYGGVTYLRHMALFYFAVSFTQNLQALFRGLAMLRVTIINTVLQISLRVAFSYLFIGRLGIAAVCWGTLLGWIGMACYGCRQIWRLLRKSGQGAEAVHHPG